LTYSCGIFGRQSTSGCLCRQVRPHLQKLQAFEKDHVLEIGTGWGGLRFMRPAATECQVTTTTISKAQHDLALERIRTAGVENRVQVLFKDYRDLKGRFDKLVSIEMIEAVGHHYLNTFFRCCSNLLTERGVMLLQAITIGITVLKKWTCKLHIPQAVSLCTAMGDAVASTTDAGSCLEDILTMRDPSGLGGALLQNIRQVRAWAAQTYSHVGVLPVLLRGFSGTLLGDVQMIFAKPLSRRDPLLPSLS
jgi:cyclopropane-fatty-acyl-phospholipid synthase